MTRGPINHRDTDTDERPDPTVNRGELREPRAMPSAMLWVCLFIALAAAAILAVVHYTSEPWQRAPLPATPPQSLQSAGDDPLE